MFKQSNFIQKKIFDYLQSWFSKNLINQYHNSILILWFHLIDALSHSHIWSSMGSCDCFLDAFSHDRPILWRSNIVIHLPQLITTSNMAEEQKHQWNKNISTNRMNRMLHRWLLRMTPLFEIQLKKLVKRTLSDDSIPFHDYQFSHNQLLYFQVVLKMNFMKLFVKYFRIMVGRPLLKVVWLSKW